MPPTRVRILLADDHEESLNQLVDLLEGEFEIIGLARNGGEVIELAASLRPDVVVSDLQMPKANGIEVTRTLRERQLCTAVVIVTIDDDAQLAKVALAAGVLGYVWKLNAGEDLVPAVYSALEGKVFVSSGIMV